MELRNIGGSAEFKWGDAVIIVKKEADEDERMQAFFSGRNAEEVWSGAQRADYCRLLCRLMVTGWKGVTDKSGKDIPYSFELLKLLPRHQDKNLMIELGMFVMKETDIVKGAEAEVKNA